MKKYRFVLSLITRDNDYQRLQAEAAEANALRLGADLRVLYADGDAIKQGRDLLDIIQTASAPPDAIIFEPVGTGLFQAARAAAVAGIGWAVLNKDAEYIRDLRREFKVPVFSVGSNHEEVGRIQGRQFSALLPNGGSMLYIQGPFDSAASAQRTTGMNQTKRHNIQVRLLRGNWTEESAFKAVASWIALPSSNSTSIGIVGSQNDAMAVGARKAFEQLTTGKERATFLQLPFTGCDGVAKTGLEWVRRGLLTATVVMPPNADVAIELLWRAFQTGAHPPEHTLIAPQGCPALQELAAKAGKAPSQ